ncbi:MAG: tetratricopeptide repeat protein, partial [Bacteroidales bacterium]|nr:tetratricopeptide repeat protein [Bacteroidales bacterium]
DYYLDKAHDLAESINDRMCLSDIFYWRGEMTRRSGEYDQAIFFYDRSIAMKKEIGDKEGLADNYGSVGLVYYNMEQLDRGNMQSELALDLYEEMEAHYEVGKMLLRIGNTNIEKGYYNQSIDYFKRALIKFEFLGNTTAIAACNNSLAVSYFLMERYDEAIKYHEENLELSRQNSDKMGMASSLNNLGNIHATIARDSLVSLYGDDFLDYVVSNPSEKYLEINSEAISHYGKALELVYELNDIEEIARVLNNLGSVYLISGKLSEAQSNLIRSLAYYKESSNHVGLSYVYIRLGEIRAYRKDFKKANEYFSLAQSIAGEMKLYEPLLEVNEGFSRLYKMQGRYRTSLDYQIKYQEIKDILHAKAIELLDEELEYRLEAEKKSNARKIDQVYQLWEQQKELERARERNRNIMLIASLAILLLLSVFAIYVYRALKSKHRANILLYEQKEEIESQRDEIEAQRDEISIQKNKLEEHKDILVEQKQAITDSIQYASKIQSAILPTPETIQHFLPKHFILYKPRDIVSGDFYWFGTRENKIVMAAVD